jgi:hypothetical protein
MRFRKNCSRRGLLSEAVQAIIQVLSLMSLTELDGVLGSHAGERNGDHELFFCEVVVSFLCVGCNLELCFRRSRTYVVKKCVRCLGRATISRSILRVKKNLLLS